MGRESYVAGTSSQDPVHGQLSQSKETGVNLLLYEKAAFVNHHAGQDMQPPARICSASENIRTGALGSWGQGDASGFVAMQNEDKERPVTQGFRWDQALRSLFKTSH